MRHWLVSLLLLVLSASALAQQDYVGRFDAYGGYSFLESGKLNLFERGFNGEFGVNVKRWVALGFDFSVFTGHSSLTPNKLNPATQAQLLPILALLPPGATISVPFNTTTYTYSAGPQINIRKLKSVTFFVRPALGALHQEVTAKPGDPLTGAIVAGLIGPSNKTSSTATFYGFGGGFDINATKHVGIRMAGDFVHYAIFQSFLNGGENAIRFSVGPSFHFGGNVQ
ncbi:MAG TPA: outer membrane beta-barrel protein [Terriglobales bacterium]|nr:outer membrane beta-barrel protein [Terriglobales bacterium]